VLSARNVPRVDRVSFSIRTGTVVPRDVRIVSVTTFPVLIEVFPRYRDYSFFVVEDEIVFVDRRHRIVDVVPLGGGARIGSSSVSTIVAVDLSEPEIREIQLVLIKRGYFHGRANGVWGPTTREALITFQRKEGFEATGRIDTRTVTALGLQGKVKVKSESSTSSSSSQSSSTTSQSSSGAQKSDQKDTTGQAPSSQRNATPDNKATNGAQKPSEQKGSNAQPAPKDQQSTNGKSAPAKSTTGQGSAEKSTQPGMSDQKPGPSQPSAASEQNEKPRQ
jgi:peptidoglycan hydrolase-like protein with peptidoglycan-binding domain